MTAAGGSMGSSIRWTCAAVLVVAGCARAPDPLPPTVVSALPAASPDPTPTPPQGGARIGGVSSEAGGRAANGGRGAANGGRGAPSDRRGEGPVSHVRAEAR